MNILTAFSLGPVVGDDGVTYGLTLARVVYLLTRWIWRGTANH